MGEHRFGEGINSFFGPKDKEASCYPDSYSASRAPPFGRIHGVAAGDVAAFDWQMPRVRVGPPIGESVAPDLVFSAYLGAFLYCDVRTPVAVAFLPATRIFEYAGITQYKPHDGVSFPVIAVPNLTVTRLKSVSNTPVVSSSSPAGHSIALHAGSVIYGQSRAGVLTPGTLAMFMEQSSNPQPCLLGSWHVLGSTGSPVLDAACTHIGTVALRSQC